MTTIITTRFQLKEPISAYQTEPTTCKTSQIQNFKAFTKILSNIINQPIQRNNLSCKPKEITSKKKLRSENQFLKSKLVNQVKLVRQRLSEGYWVFTEWTQMTG
ncbi:Hypothetical_protein [Hexamita inflata]|uniref:Hypothetical_protein n=1 Tax=Hexamita inflata TaxID=28002 RepID=A0AA86NFR7_9EUKA|nr:Hypothetical protein HINF_LOCUS5871 [Hexamita inflata]